MAEITKLRFEDVDWKWGRGRKTHPELDAVRLLVPGEAVSFPCRWTHFDHRCSGATSAQAASRRVGFKVKTLCKDGVLYVGRPS